MCLLVSSPSFFPFCPAHKILATIASFYFSNVHSMVLVHGIWLCYCWNTGTVLPGQLTLDEHNLRASRILIALGSSMPGVREAARTQ